MLIQLALYIYNRESKPSAAETNLFTIKTHSTLSKQRAEKSLGQ